MVSFLPSKPRLWILIPSPGHAGFLDWPMRYKVQEEWGEYEQRNHRFNAPPSDELDDSWRKLLEGVQYHAIHVVIH
jgi:hypothetical protein